MIADTILDRRCWRWRGCIDVVKEDMQGVGVTEEDVKDRVILELKIEEVVCV